MLDWLLSWRQLVTARALNHARKLTLLSTGLTKECRSLCRHGTHRMRTAVLPCCTARYAFHLATV
jgi:hypothetical protein